MNRALVYATVVVMLTAMVFTVSCCVNADTLFKSTHQKTENLDLSVAGVGTVDIETRVGSITVNGADIDKCLVKAEIIAKAYSKEKAEKLADSIEIETEQDGDILKIRATYPEDLKKSSATVNFEVSVPLAFVARCKTTVGSVTVSDIRGTVDAQTDVGSVTCEGVVADLKLQANVGSITVVCGAEAPSAYNADVTTNVGSIHFTSPAELSAEVSASTNVGSVSTTKPITVVGKLGKNMNGTIGNGDGRITLSTNVGSIEIK